MQVDGTLRPSEAKAVAEEVLPSGMNTNVFDYLERLPPDALDKLYGQDAGPKSHGLWTCRALLQSLPQLAKQHVMRLLFVEGFVDKGMLKSWVKKEYQRVHNVSVRKVKLCRLCALRFDESGCSLFLMLGLGDRFSSHAGLAIMTGSVKQVLEIGIMPVSLLYWIANPHLQMVFLPRTS